jgi:hypothetical protein
LSLAAGSRDRRAMVAGAFMHETLGVGVLQEIFRRESTIGSGEYPAILRASLFINVACSRHSRVVCHRRAQRTQLVSVARWRQEDPEFAAKWDDAVADGIDLLETEVFRRAMEYSDKLAMFLLKKRRPEVYGDRMT